MTDTIHNVIVKIKGDTKDFETSTARVAKSANKLSKEQKQQFGNQLKSRKELKKVSPTQSEHAKLLSSLKKEIDLERQKTAEIRKQTQELQRRVRVERQTQGMKARAYRDGTFRGGFGNAMGFRNPYEHNNISMRSRIGGAIGGGLRAGIGIGGMGLAALASIPIAAISNDYQSYFSYARQKGSLTGLAKGAPFGAGVTGSNLEAFKNRMVEYGYNPEDSIAGLRSFSRATGSAGYAGAGMKAAKALGLESEEVSSLFGTVRSASGGFGEKGYREFQRILAAGVKGGVDASTLPEYLEGLKGLTSRAAGGAGGSVSSGNYAALLAMFEKSGAAGLKGARGAATLSALEEGFKSPGGGDEGLAVVMGSLGFGRAGGNTSYYAAKKMMQQGFVGEGGTGRLKGLFDYSDRITGGGEESNMYLEGIMGGRLTLDQIETVRSALNNGSSASEIDSMLKDMTASELDHLTSIDNAMQEFLAATVRSADIANKDIARGEKNHESVERIQDTIHKLLEDTLPIVQRTLPLIADGMEFIGGGITKMTEVIGGLVDYFTNDGGSATMMDEAYGRATRTSESFDAFRARGIIGGTGELAPDDLTATTGFASRLIGDMESITSNLTSDVMAQRVARGDTGARDLLETERNTDMTRLTVVLEELNRNLLARGESAGVVGAVDTSAEIVAVLTAYQQSIPPGVRAMLDSTGGAP